MASESVPSWVYAVIVVLVVIILGMAAFLCIRAKRRSRPPTVDIAEHNDKKQHIEIVIPNENNNDTPPSNQRSNPTPSDNHAPADRRSMTQAKKTKAELPLPPPSTSLFSDKMELSSEEAMALFDRYVNAGLDKDNHKGFFSMGPDKGGLAHLQQKAATIRSTLKQSLRRQKSTKSHAPPLDQLFARPSGDTESRSTNSSTHLPASAHEQPSSLPSPSPSHSPLPLPRPSFARSESPASVHDDVPLTPPVRRLDTTRVADVATSLRDSALQDTDAKEPTEVALHAARRVIRTASRKSKSRSMLVNEEAVRQLFSEPGEPADETNNVHPFATLRSIGGTGLDKRETITSGSVHRSVRKSIVGERSAAVSVRESAKDIAGWWSQDNHDTSSSSNTAIPERSEPWTDTLGRAGNTAQGRTRQPVQGLFDPPERAPAAMPPPRLPGKLTEIDADDPSAMLFDAERTPKPKGDVHSIRRILQATMSESDSLTSLNTFAEPSPSRLADTARSLQGEQTQPKARSTEPLRQPIPAASFSSSTVHTMVPAQETEARLNHPEAAQEKIEISDSRAFGYQARAPPRVVRNDIRGGNDAVY